MKHKKFIVAVLLFLLDGVLPVLVPELANVKDTVTENHTNTTKPTTQKYTEKAEPGVNYLKNLFGQKVKGPSLIVEVNDATDDASIKIIDLPLVRYTNNGTVSKFESQVPSAITTPTTLTKALHGNSRRKRDVYFKIYDLSVIKALINAWKNVNWESADFMQDNIQNLEVSMNIEDNDWKSNRWQRSIKNQSEVDMKQDKKRLNSTKIPKFSRSRADKFEIYDMSVIKATIDALQKVDSQKAKLFKNNIDRVIIWVEVKDNDIFIDDHRIPNISERSKVGLETRTTPPNYAYIPYARRVRDVKFKIYDIHVIRAFINALREIDTHRANMLQDNINRVEVKVEVEDVYVDEWMDRWRSSNSKQFEWDFKERKQRNMSISRRKRDIDFKIYDRTVIRALADALRKVDPQKANIIMDNIDRVEVDVKIDDDYDDWRGIGRYRSNSDQSEIGWKERTYTERYRRLHDVDFKIYDRTVIRALINALHKVDPQRANLMLDNIDRVEVKVDVEYYDNGFI